MDIESLYKVYLKSPKVSTDTRSDLNGCIFFCLKGPNFDANAFAEEALVKGAFHVVTDDQSHEGKKNMTVVTNALTSLQELAKHHRQHFKFPVIGLTGSNGKTTHKELISAVLSRRFRCYSTRGNLNNHIGVPLTLLSIPLDAGIAVIEMGANHQGEIRELSQISNPDYALITNIGKAHLEGFGGIDGVRKGKGELFDHMRKREGSVVFVNGDDNVLTEMSSGLRTILYGTRDNNYVSGTLLKGADTVTFKYKQGAFESDLIHSKMAGDYNFINLLAAVCIGRYFEVVHEEIKLALETYAPTLNRSQLLKTDHNTVLMDAYNANPSSMRLALENFAQMQGDGKMAILGHMLELGEDSVSEHQALIDHVIKLNINAILIGAQFKECNLEGLSFIESTDRLLEYLKEKPIRNATVLLKGSRMVALEKALPYL